MKILFLGTGSLEAIPRGDKCPQCLSKDPKDRRRRSAILIDDKILIDAGPDVSRQLCLSQTKRLEAVFLTHSHKDVAGGLGWLRKMTKAPIYLAKRTAEDLKLQPPAKFQGKPRLQIIENQTRVKVGSVQIQAIKVKHSKTTVTFGYLVNNKFLYIPDILNTQLILSVIKKAQVVAVDGSMFERDFGGHQAMVKTIKTLRLLKNLKFVYFTHNGHTHIPHRILQKKIQILGGEKFKLAYDGMKVTIK